MIDGLWKLAIYKFFPEFIAFFLPDFFVQIDWQVPAESLDKELQELFPDQIQESRVDQLIKVKLVDGNICRILLHIEIQGYFDPDFPKRMFRYFTRIFERYETTVFSFALITERLLGTVRPSYYRLPNYGFENVFEYHTWQLADYEMETLFTGNNPFGLLMAAFKQIALQSQPAAITRAAFIQRLIRKLKEIEYDDEQIQYFFLFLRIILRLDDQEIEVMKNQMLISNNAPKFGLLDNPEAMELFKSDIAAIKQAGKIEGKIEGRIEGRIEGKIETARQLKALNVAIEIIEQATGLSTAEIAAL